MSKYSAITQKLLNSSYFKFNGVAHPYNASNIMQLSLFTPTDLLVGKYFTLEQFCICSNTYKKYSDLINPLPENGESIIAIQHLNHFIIDPIINNFGLDNFKLTYGFCSRDLKKYLDKKNPITGEKNGRICPAVDQHMAHEINTKGQYYCKRLGAACDFAIADVESDRIIRWIVESGLPFDSIYYYGAARPLHISYGSQHKRDIWTFTRSGSPVRYSL